MSGTDLIAHHGAVDGVTGSCHELKLGDGRSVLIDCGLFQGTETADDGANTHQLAIGFEVAHLQAVILTHVHIDHVGRLPHLLAAGFRGPILCSEASAELLPLVLEDALKVGVTREARLIEAVLRLLKTRLVPLRYGEWHSLIAGDPGLRIRLQQAGHILGSAYVECDLSHGGSRTRVLFSGDLGAPHTPLLPDPTPPESADIVVLESTYGDRVHEDRTTRHERLRALVEHAFQDGGTLLIPAFSIGRTQELLYELETLVHEYGTSGTRPAGEAWRWEDLAVVLDSPLAANFTAGYRRLRAHWDEEATTRLAAGRHPLAFERMLTVADHDAHLRMVAHLAREHRPAVVIAASGMCAGGRIMDYLKAMLGDPRHDLLFVGYQAAGTPGWAIQRYGPRGGYVELDGRRYDIRARIHTLGGYSAHADQQNLSDFIAAMATPPREVILVHGEQRAKRTLQGVLQDRFPGTEVRIG
ncbi:MBL fold hydrolase [Thiocapsa imhoffii]|uniref:MBL fold hydrolase n=2 Tax=Thiocapsa imhoffii TaxID=382777 RepID=A0A9X0WLE8_9GAMM|nr:MBL fold hydrolase [Thiocapsa imhoffii]